MNEENKEKVNFIKQWNKYLPYKKMKIDKNDKIVADL